jgi:hypothetical protein
MSRKGACEFAATIMALGHVPFWARIDGPDPGVVSWPIPLLIKNLNNPL